MCKLCRKYPCDYRCPNYESPKATFYCSICGDGMYEYDRYVENDNCEYAHLDCLSQMDIYELVEWFGFDVKTIVE